MASAATIAYRKAFDEAKENLRKALGKNPKATNISRVYGLRKAGRAANANALIQEIAAEGMMKAATVGAVAAAKSAAASAGQTKNDFFRKAKANLTAKFGKAYAPNIEKLAATRRRGKNNRAVIANIEAKVAAKMANAAASGAAAGAKAANKTAAKMAKTAKAINKAVNKTVNRSGYETIGNGHVMAKKANNVTRRFVKLVEYDLPKNKKNAFVRNIEAVVKKYPALTRRANYGTFPNNNNNSNSRRNNRNNY
jgi:hypothetical protein